MLINPTTSIPLDRAAAVTPDDNITFEPSTILVQGAGAIAVQPAGNRPGDTVIYTATAGQVLPVLVSRVLATGTAATGIFRQF